MIFSLALGAAIGMLGTKVSLKRINKRHSKPSTKLTHKQPLLPDLVHEEPQENNNVEYKARKNFLFASGGTLLALGGSTLYAPLYIPGMLLMAYPFRDTVKDAYHALVKEKRVGLDMLVAVEVPGAILSGNPMIGALGIWFQRLMRLQLAKTQNHSRQSLVNLFGEQPRTVWVLLDDIDNQCREEIEIPFEQVKPDDRVIVTAGQTIPVDGVINEGMFSCIGGLRLLYCLMDCFGCHSWPMSCILCTNTDRHRRSFLLQMTRQKGINNPESISRHFTDSLGILGHIRQ